MEREFSPLEERMIQALIFGTGMMVQAQVLSLIERDNDAARELQRQLISSSVPPGHAIDPRIRKERENITRQLVMVATIQEMTLGISA
jgi:hypothetical protein